MSGENCCYVLHIFKWLLSTLSSCARIPLAYVFSSFAPSCDDEKTLFGRPLTVHIVARVFYMP